MKCDEGTKISYKHKGGQGDPWGSQQGGIQIETRNNARGTTTIMCKGRSTRVMNKGHKSRNLEHGSKWYDMFRVGSK